MIDNEERIKIRIISHEKKNNRKENEQRGNERERIEIYKNENRIKGKKVLLKV